MKKHAAPAKKKTCAHCAEEKKWFRARLWQGVFLTLAVLLASWLFTPLNPVLAPGLIIFT